MLRAFLVSAVLVALLWASASAPAGADGAGAGGEPSDAFVLQHICGACHARPGLGVPQLGDEAAWAPLREQGLDALLRNTVDGVRGMPPLGTCGWCSEATLRRLVAIMAGLETPAP